MTDQTAEFRVEFSWRNTYGQSRRVVTLVHAETELRAVKDAREKIASIYGIERARFTSVQVA